MDSFLKPTPCLSVKLLGGSLFSTPDELNLLLHYLLRSTAHFQNFSPCSQGKQGLLRIVAKPTSQEFYNKTDTTTISQHCFRIKWCLNFKLHYFRKGIKVPNFLQGKKVYWRKITLTCKTVMSNLVLRWSEMLTCQLLSRFRF